MGKAGLIRPRKSTRTVTVYGIRKRTLKQSFKLVGTKLKLEDEEENVNPKNGPNAQPNVRVPIDVSQFLPQSRTGDVVCASGSVIDSQYSSRKKERLEEWKALRDQFCSIGLQQCCPESPVCHRCGEECRLFRCLDCSTWEVLCQNCLQLKHNYSHLHMFETWQNGTFVGYVGEYPVWRSNHNCIAVYLKDIVIVDDKGRQHVRSLQFCKCESEAATLLRYWLWPSSPTYPKLAFSLDLLWWLYGLLLESQISVKGFCESLKARLPKHLKGYVDSEVQNIYKVLITETFEEFKYFVHTTEKLSHIDTQSPTFDDGRQCAACYKVQSKIYSFDADFQLVRKASSGRSWDSTKHENHFFLPQESVDTFVSSYNTDSKPAFVDCSNFQAASAIRSKNKSKKLAETAVFGSTCRHGFPKYFFSLKHGERLAYSVFLLEKLVEEVKDGQTLYIMYDIACILHKHLKKNNREDLLNKVKFAIPIFHCYGHKLNCQLQYSPRRRNGLGLTDGESLERLWSYLGKFSRITKEMTPENRVDLLTDALIYFGQKLNDKCVNSLAEKYWKAVDSEKMNRSELEKAISPLAGVSLDLVERWIEDEASNILSDENTQFEEKLTMTEEYSLVLEQLQFIRKKCETDGDNPAESVAESTSQIKKLEKKARRHEKKLSIHWDVNQQIYRDTLKSGKEKQRKNILAKIRKDLSERTFMLDLIKKYARGQAVAIRLCKQLKTLMSKIIKNIKLYNSVGGPESVLPLIISFEDVKLLDGHIWQIFGNEHVSELPVSTKIKITGLKLMVDRSVEEQSLLKEEMVSYIECFKHQHSVTEQQSSNDNKAVKAILLREGLYLEKKLLEAQHKFEPFIGQVEVPTTFSTTVDIQLITTSSRVWNNIMDQVLPLIEMFEKEYVGDDDHTVDEDSEDDIYTSLGGSEDDEDSEDSEEDL